MTYYKGIKLVGNGFLLLCVLALTLSASTAVYLSKQNKPQSSRTIPSSDVTINWKSITSNTVGITFKYPNSLLSYSNLPNSQNSAIFGFDAFNNQAKRDHRTLLESDLELEVVVYKPVVGSIAPYLTTINAKDGINVTQPFPGVTGAYTKVKTLTNGNIQSAFIYAEPAREYSEYDGIIVQNNKNVAIIRLMTGSHTRREELLPLLDQILSTFKFID